MFSSAVCRPDRPGEESVEGECAHGGVEVVPLVFGLGVVLVEVGEGEVGFLPLVCAAAADEDLVEDVEQESVAAGVAVGAGEGDAAGVEFTRVWDSADDGVLGLRVVEVGVVVGHVVLSRAGGVMQGPQDERRSGSSRPPLKTSHRHPGHGVAGPGCR